MKYAIIPLHVILATLATLILIVASLNSAKATIYYSKNMGSWNKVSTWSLISHSGPDAGSWPAAGDTAYIETFDILVNDADAACAYLVIKGSGSSDGSLHLDGYILNVSGDVLVDAAGGAKEAHLHLQAGAIMMVGGNVLMTRSAGFMAVEFLIDNDGVALVFGNMTVEYIGGTKGIKVLLKNDAQLVISGALTLDVDGGSDSLYVLINDDSRLNVSGDLTLDWSGGSATVSTNVSDNAVLDVDGDIEFIGITGSRAEIELNNNAKLYLKGDMNRTASPNNYGTFDMKNNSIIEFDGTTLQTIGQDAGAGSDNFIYENVIINNSFGISPQLILEGDVTILGSLTLSDGVIQVGGSDLIIETDASTSGGSINSYVRATTAFTGTLKKKIDLPLTFEFMIGDEDEYTPFTFILNASTGAGKSTSMQTTDSLHPHILPAGHYITRYWRMNTTGYTSINYNVSYNYTDADVFGTEADLLTSMWNGAYWTTYQLAVTATNTLYTIAGLTDIPSAFDWSAGGTSALPISLVEFDAIPENGTVTLKWSTAVETDNDFFTIERSQDGLTYEFVTTVIGAGTTLQTINYSSSDADPYQGTSYYRLSQTDFDGQTVMFDPVSVNISAPATSSLQVYPNPVVVGQSIRLSIENVQADEKVLVVLLDKLGREVYSKMQITNYNGVLRGIDISKQLVPGIYMVVASSSTVVYEKKLLIVDQSGNSMFAKN